MFPATAADDKNFHSGRLSRWDISDGSVLAKSSERKPVAAVLRFRQFSQSLRIAKRLQRKRRIKPIQPFWFVTLHLRRARLILQVADEVFARFGLKAPMSFAHRVGPDRG